MTSANQSAASEPRSGLTATTGARYLRYFARPAAIVRGLRRGDVRPDLVAGLTVAMVAIPQSIAYAAIANLPPHYGLYSAAVAAIVGALWGSSRFLSTGPTNAASLLVLSILLPLAPGGAPEYLLAASLLAVMVGVFRVVMGLAGFGVLVNYASRSVLLGFMAGAAVLIALNQLPQLLRLSPPSALGAVGSVVELAPRLAASHLPSLALGLGTLALTLLVNRIWKTFPGSLVAMVAATAVVAGLGVGELGVRVVGEIPRALPGFTAFSLDWLLDGGLVRAMITGALAVAVLGLVEALSIARSLARETGDRLDINQEFVGQGMANVAAGLLGGYTCSGSFTRSAVNFQAGARTPMASVYSGLAVLLGTLAMAPYASLLPRSALAGVLLLIAYKMIDVKGIGHVFEASRQEGAILAATFLATLLLPLEFAVLSGVLLSLGMYVHQSSQPSVHPAVPDETYRHFVERPGASACSQLGVMDIRGPLFFGAADHVEKALRDNLEENPGQHHLLLRMHGVNQCDLAGIDMLESVVKLYRELGGDLFMVQVRPPVREIMEHSGFASLLGADHFLGQEEAIDQLFETVIDPAVCIYECEQRVFAECQAVPKHQYDAHLPSFRSRPIPAEAHLSVREVEAMCATTSQLTVLDVREAEEFRLGHLPGSRLLPLRSVVAAAGSLPKDRPLLLICRSGRRSTRAMRMLLDLGFSAVYNLKGGILSWKAAGRNLEVD
ncbi:MAG: SulP family inorganic anion transporter [Acidobacteriota bacterium]